MAPTTDRRGGGVDVVTLSGLNSVFDKYGSEKVKKVVVATTLTHGGVVEITGAHAVVETKERVKERVIDEEAEQKRDEERKEKEKKEQEEKREQEQKGQGEEKEQEQRKEGGESEHKDEDSDDEEQEEKDKDPDLLEGSLFDKDGKLRTFEDLQGELNLENPDAIENLQKFLRKEGDKMNRKEGKGKGKGKGKSKGKKKKAKSKPLPRIYKTVEKEVDTTKRAPLQVSSTSSTASNGKGKDVPSPFTTIDPATQARFAAIESRESLKRRVLNLQHEIETSVFDWTDHLQDEKFMQYFTAEERAAVATAVTDLETWFYEVGESATTTEDLDPHWRAFSATVAPGTKRQQARAALPLLTKEVMKYVKQATDRIETLLKAMPWADDDEKARIEAAVDEFNTWFATTRVDQENRALHEDPLVTTELVDTKKGLVEAALARFKALKKPTTSTTEGDEREEKEEGEEGEEGEETGGALEAEAEAGQGQEEAGEEQEEKEL